jgi:hypothetical protein
MNAYESMTKGRIEALQAEPSPELRNRVFSSVKEKTSAAPLSVRRKPKLRALLIAAALVALSSAAAFAVAALPGYRMTLDADQLTVNLYERGMLPHDVPSNFIWVMSIDGYVIIDRGYPANYTSLYSLEALQEVMGVPLLVPANLEKNEAPVIIRYTTHNKNVLVDICFMDGYRDESRGVTVKNNLDKEEFFFLSQVYVGEKRVTFDSIGEYTETEVNGHKAVWFHGRGGNGALYWIQDGYLIWVLPCDIDFDYVMRIAESLVPLQVT